ncbi:hypothetical protein ACOQFV_14640 [Nocardiopsis changdeensis]|uniref:Thymidylate kinase n=1 Tax=Nocardiopsis changdeensis TaxID=2831969 RepID=A0ABX8BSH2_9ACTN|nr:MULTISPECIES: hypothetical protein [Nocardiopsis]QUX25190.1 hypothetical protein KGD84_13545 [Nocardiopsis changdeensis]QYX35577.1 hypothetical protein K1J57_23000 [Nocardiopsis sp. MT53]
MTGFVSLNGPDNSGKSTQVRMLADGWEGFCDLGPVHRHDPVPWSRVSGQDYAAWWFATSTTEELTAMLFAGHAKRARALPPGRTGLLDRGWYMLLATAIATCAVKESVSVEGAWHRVRALVGAEEPEPCELPVLLLPSTDTERSIAIARRRDHSPWTGTYLDYQMHLHRVLLRMAHQDVFVEVVSDDLLNADETHVRIRRALLARGIGAPANR